MHTEKSLLKFCKIRFILIFRVEPILNQKVRADLNLLSFKNIVLVLKWNIYLFLYIVCIIISSSYNYLLLSFLYKHHPLCKHNIQIMIKQNKTISR